MTRRVVALIDGRRPGIDPRRAPRRDSADAAASLPVETGCPADRHCCERGAKCHPSGVSRPRAGQKQQPAETSLDIGAGHAFQSMSAASAPDGIASVKWVAVAPVPAGGEGQGVNALICVNDYETGTPITVLDGDEMTLVRTAAMSAAAATRLAPEDPRTIGFVGCGRQAHAHFEALRRPGNRALRR